MSRAFLLACILCASSAAHAVTIATDGSVGPRQTMSGPGNFTIPDSLGARRGTNLFHSFSDFQIGTGDSATFTQNSTGIIENIFARVTGGTASAIDGKLASSISGANLYFLNPTGVSFGPKSTVNVDGSFTVTTANHLAFSDGTKFSADAAALGDTLTASDIASFGFLTNAPGSIDVFSEALTMQNGKALTLVGGDIRISRLPAEIGRGNRAAISAPDGTLTITSVNTRGSVALDGTIAAQGPKRHGAAGLAMSDGSIDTSGEHAGRITIRAPKLTLDFGSVISSTITSDATGQPIAIAISGKLSLADESRIITSTDSRGRAGAITVAARSAQLINKSTIGSVAEFPSEKTAAAGLVKIRAGRLTLASGSNISTTTDGAGRAGNIDIAVTDRLQLNGAQTRIAADTTLASADGDGGRGGNIRIRAGTLAVTGNASIHSRTEGNGDSGNISADAHTLHIAHQASIHADSGRLSQDPDTGAITILAAHGNAGRIAIRAKNLTVSDNARISSDTYSHGHSGTVTLAADTARIADGGRITANTGFILGLGPKPDRGLKGGRGHGGNIAITATTLFLDDQANGNGTGIFANNDSPERLALGGNIRVHADQLTIRSGALITTRVTGPGTAGDLDITARDLLIDRAASDLFTGIAGDSATPSAGRAGNVRVTAHRASILGGGQISSFIAGTGDSGDVTLTADELTIGKSGTQPSVIGTDSQSTGLGGDGGNVTVTAGKLTISQGGRISAITAGAGAAGQVRVTASHLTIDGAHSPFGTGIFATSESLDQPGPGSSIAVQARTLTLANQGGISARTQGPGTGGSVTVTADRLTLDQFSTIDASATGLGDAGSVTIFVKDPLTLSGSSNVQTGSQRSAAGTVAITSQSSIRLTGDSTITVRATAGDAGSIRLIAPKFITLQNSTILAEAGLNGGDVFIDPEFVILDHSRISANAILGAGGNITLIAGSFLSSESAITASSEASVQGTIDIQSPDAQLANALTPLQGNLIDTKIKLTDRCPMRLGGDLSSFLVIGRGSLPPAPEDMR